MSATECVKQYCGKVFVKKDYVMMVECKFCGEEFVLYEQFLKHIFNEHFENIDNDDDDADDDDDDDYKIAIFNGHDSDNDSTTEHREISRAEQSTEVSTSNTPAKKAKVSTKEAKNQAESDQQSTATTSLIRTELKKTRKTQKDMERKFKCKFCDDAFYTGPNLKKHEQRHTDNKPFPCTECDKRFFTRIELTTHMRWHTGERPFVCLYCGRGFVSRSALNIHEKRHLNERIYKCDQCSKSYFTSVDLKQHMRVHTGDRIYKCTYCANSFSRSATLRNHMKLHENAFRFVCNVCDRRFNLHNTLMWHVKNKHDVATKADEGTESETVGGQALLQQNNETSKSGVENVSTCSHCEQHLLLEHEHTVHAAFEAATNDVAFDFV